MIKYPVSFWMMFCIVVVTALLAVTWHGALLIVAVANVFGILALPTVSRKEMDYQRSKFQQEKAYVVVSDTRETATGDRHGDQGATSG